MVTIVKGTRQFDRMPTIGASDQIVPSGGSVGQILTKDSGSDYDYSWQNAPGGSVLVKTDFTEITVDTTTTSTGWGTTLLSLNMTPASASNYFLVHFDASGDLNTSSDGEILFRLSMGLTGSETVRRSTYIFSDDGSALEAGSCALTYRAQASGAGQHTFIMEWRVTTSTGRIRPVANPDYDHASLLVQEVTG